MSKTTNRAIEKGHGRSRQKSLELLPKKKLIQKLLKTNLKFRKPLKKVK